MGWEFKSGLAGWFWLNVCHDGVVQKQVHSHIWYLRRFKPLHLQVVSTWFLFYGRVTGAGLFPDGPGSHRHDLEEESQVTAVPPCMTRPRKSCGISYSTLYQKGTWKVLSRFRRRVHRLPLYWKPWNSRRTCKTRILPWPFLEAIICHIG